jgi:glutamine amidotransferase
MIAIIDYDMGNLRSVQKAFEAVGHRAVVTRDPAVIADAGHVVLPGVGAFGDCMRNLHAYGLIDPIKQAIAAGKPFLGICLGLQLLFTESEEFGRHQGLNIIPGRVVRFAFTTHLKVPHMGWNAIVPKRPSAVLAAVPEGAYMYFVHSYYVVP